LNDKRFSVQRNARIRSATSPEAKDTLIRCYDYLSKWMIFNDEPMHKVLRTVLNPAYSPKAIRELQATVDELAKELIAPFQKTGRLDVVQDFAHPLTGMTNAHRVGFPATMIEEVRQWSDDVFRLFGSGIVTTEIVEAAHQSLDACAKYVTELAQQQATAADETTNLLSLLLAAEKDGTVTREQLVASASMVMIGGHEAARHMIGNGLIALFRDPSQMTKLQADMGLLDHAVDELLRYASPPLSSLRQATQDVELHGSTISAGEFVFCMLRAGNHDPSIFADPDHVDIERPSPHHLGFGFGIHHCIGAPLATMQIRTGLRTLLEMHPRLAVDPNELDWIPSLSSRGVRSLPITLQSVDISQKSAARA
jgi:cytochrome P450